ncbi:MULTISPECIES: hypothetical protein [unclassified Streptomyces]|uniref:hypothetical protein n=1 Tax=unclassified Streptomyces TaxID=2593676 RepID=UPI0034098499
MNQHHRFQPDGRPRLRLRRVPALLVSATAVLSLATLTACGGDADSDTGVASVTETGTGTASSDKAQGKESKASEAGRPQLRLDTSQEEEDRLFNVWASCIHEHGVPMQDIVKDGKKVPDNSHRAYPAAAKACIGKQPVGPPELDRAKNPHYMDDFRAQIACLHKAGVKVEPMADGEGYSFPAGEVKVPNLTELEQRCLVEAFSD